MAVATIALIKVMPEKCANNHNSRNTRNRNSCCSYISSWTIVHQLVWLGKIANNNNNKTNDDRKNDRKKLFFTWSTPLLATIMFVRDLRWGKFTINLSQVERSVLMLKCHILAVPLNSNECIKDQNHPNDPHEDEDDDCLCQFSCLITTMWKGMKMLLAVNVSCVISPPPLPRAH